ncbi:anti-sigma factor family protein [Anaerotignum sp.]
MNCEAVKEMLWAYLEKELTAEEAVKIEEHLKNCAECREELELQKEMMETLSGLPDEELPDGYHTELMQKLQAEAAPNVVPFPQKAAQKKKKQPMWKQWGMIAAAVLVVVAAGGMDGMLEMRKSQNEAVQEMKAADAAEPMEASIEDAVVAEEKMQKDVSISYKKMSAPAAGEETANVTTQSGAKQEEMVMDDMAAVPEVASMEAEEDGPVAYSTTRSAKVEAIDKVALQAADTAAAMTAVQKAIAESGGFEEDAAEGNVFAAIPVDNYDAFVKALEGIGTLNWTQKGVQGEGASYRTVEISFKTK